MDSAATNTTFQAEREELGVYHSAPLLKYIRVMDDALPPFKASPWAAGFDLFAAEDGFVRRKGKSTITTGLKISMPVGTYGRIAGRSSLARENGIMVGAGVIDPDYRGVVEIVLFNLGKDDFIVKAGQRIAQIIPEKIKFPTAVEVEDLDPTERGEGGFGSTGTD